MSLLFESEFERLDSLAAPFEFKSLFKTDKDSQRFITSGTALEQIFEQELFLGKYPTFEDYCQNRFGTSEWYTCNFIKAVQIAKLLEREQFVPKYEYQIRTLLPLSPEQQIKAWRLAISKAGGKEPDWKHVQKAAKEVKEGATKNILSVYPEASNIIVNTSDDLVYPSVELLLTSERPLELYVGHSNPGTLIKWVYLERYLHFLAKITLEDILQHGLRSVVFVYRDHNGGPGSYEKAEDKVFKNEVGSPLIALRTLVPWFANEKKIPLIVELNEPFYYRPLCRSLKERGHRIDQGREDQGVCPRHLIVGNQMDYAFIRKLINEAGQHPPRSRKKVRGVDFFDPGPELLPLDLIKGYADCKYYRNMELLLYMNINGGKRVKGSLAKLNPGVAQVRMMDWVGTLNRPHTYVTEPTPGSSHFTLVACSHFMKVKEFEELGFYHTKETCRGREISENIG